ncbi:DUF5011 domain-containing protein [Flavobacteriales bacterium]|jgi:hypothetical protein|nr:DUF5011 domain-containing protein [Flavobacteriales bacterium]
MKNIKLNVPIISGILILLVVMGSCKKKKTAPTLTLNGDSAITMCVGDEYIEAGASAVDAYGDDVEVMITYGYLDVTSSGIYTIGYSATDKNENVSTAEVTITVEVCASSMLGDYTISSDCQALGIDLISNDQSILPGLNQNQFIIDNFNFAISQITASVEGSNITVPQNTFTIGSPPLSTDVTISGAGTVNETGTEMVINYTYDAGIAGSGTCTATYTRN